MKDEKIYAMPLNRPVKVFVPEMKQKYMSGKPGDYLAVRCEELHDIYVIPKDIFLQSYVPV